MYQNHYLVRETMKLKCCSCNEEHYEGELVEDAIPPQMDGRIWQLGMRCNKPGCDGFMERAIVFDP